VSEKFATLMESLENCLCTDNDQNHALTLSYEGNNSDGKESNRKL